MVLSMTGFGRSVGEFDRGKLTVEIKSVNHRFSEISIKMPRQFLSIEDKIKKAITQSVHRGRVEAFIQCDGESLVERSIKVDWNLLEQYAVTLSTIKNQYNIQEPLTLNQLLAIDDVISINEETKIQDELEINLINVVYDAVLHLVTMRKAEGEQLKIDISKRLTQISIHTDELKRLAPLVIDSYREKVQKRISEYVTGIIDENRILTEVALFADRVDISEELTRIDSHIHQFLETLEVIGPIGRKLDFIVQELNREANTIGSKANDRQIAKVVVDIKSMIEKIKEQVQNIE
ncbi:YicC/YloC family endoribonuclease [Metabacillus herbersteinensis]|uniref:YicC/YloC family endoribonuclease n=1 Tax=Metabacillus herbersteinensis TaxID=283816 RepID=A0ABV6GCT1_9BACI